VRSIIRILIYLKAVPYIQDACNYDIAVEPMHGKRGIMLCAAIRRGCRCISDERIPAPRIFLLSLLY